LGTEVNPKTVGQLWEPSHGIQCYGGDLFNAMCSIDDDDDCIKKTRIVKVIETNSGHKVVIWHHGAWWAYKSMDYTTFEKIGTIFDTDMA